MYIKKKWRKQRSKKCHTIFEQDLVEKHITWDWASDKKLMLHKNFEDIAQ